MKLLYEFSVYMYIPLGNVDSSDTFTLYTEPDNWRDTCPYARITEDPKICFVNTLKIHTKHKLIKRM